MKSKIPRKIWLLWLQGVDDMPPLVQHCCTSWQRHNPDWEIIMLDKNNIADYIDLPNEYTKLNIQSTSDFIRISLLYKYGGVWTDATTFCTTPLSNWVDEAAGSGFFAFSNHSKRTEISNWFIVADINNEIIRKLYLRICHFWRNGPIAPLSVVYMYQYLYAKIGRLSLYVYYSLKKLLVPFKTLFGLYPYAWFHYLFDELCRKDKMFGQSWENVIKISSQPHVELQRLGLNSALTDQSINFIKTSNVPVHKLNWREDCISKNPNENNLSYFLSFYLSK